MKSLEKFSTHKLSKEQMNNICGGKQFDCTVGGELVAFVHAESQAAAEEYISGIYGEKASCS